MHTYEIKIELDVDDEIVMNSEEGIYYHVEGIDCDDVNYEIEQGDLADYIHGEDEEESLVDGAVEGEVYEAEEFPYIIADIYTENEPEDLETFKDCVADFIVKDSRGYITIDVHITGTDYVMDWDGLASSPYERAVNVDCDDSIKVENYVKATIKKIK